LNGRGRGRGHGIVLGLVLVLVAGNACELSEVVTAGSQDIVIAEVYLRTDGQSQTAWLHRTRQGDLVSQRVPGARIVVTNENTGRAVSYAAALDSMCVVTTRQTRDDILGSCYVATPPPGFVTAGHRYSLEIVLPEGGQMTGVTTVPGEFRILSPGAPVCGLPPSTRLDIEWTVSQGAWVYAAETHISGLRRVLEQQGITIEQDPLRLFGLSISSADTTIVFPAEFGLFDRFNPDLTEALAAIQPGLPLGTAASVVVAAADRNYVNWERGGNFNPSGLVRIPSIRGDGTGAFGSMVTRTLEIRIGESGLPDC
jgi:hypothetical protein